MVMQSSTVSMSLLESTTEIPQELTSDRFVEIMARQADLMEAKVATATITSGIDV
jgi:hypothetical protein